jgi:hypothetical protein
VRDAAVDAGLDAASDAAASADTGPSTLPEAGGDAAVDAGPGSDAQSDAGGILSVCNGGKVGSDSSKLSANSMYGSVEYWLPPTNAITRFQSTMFVPGSPPHAVPCSYGLACSRCVARIPGAWAMACCSRY